MKKILLLVGGPHHDFEGCGSIIKEYLEGTEQFAVEMTADTKRLTRLDGFDAVMVYTCLGKLTAAQERNLLEFVNGGGGLVAIHSANISFLENEGYVEMVGTKFTDHGPVARFDVEMLPAAAEFVPRVATEFSVEDEFYKMEKATSARLRPFMQGAWQFEKLMLGYVRNYGKGRVFYTGLGHHEPVVRHPEFLNHLFKGLRYATKQKEGKVRVGLLGYGPAYGMGGHHSGQIAATQGFELAAVCDLDPARLEAAKKEQGEDIATFADTGEMARSGLIDLGIIILPHAYHTMGIRTLLESGLNVVTEKPFAVHASDCDELIALAEEKGVTLSVYHNRHWDPDIRTILEIIGEGKIGDVFSIECNMTGFGRPGQTWRSHKPISGGAAYDMGAHQFEKIFQIVPRTDRRGNPVNRKGTLFGNYQKKRWHDSTNDDFFRAYVRFDSGLEAQLMVSDICASPKPLWSILGTHGSIVIESWQGDATITTQSPDGRLITESRPQTPNTGPTYYRNLADHLLCGMPLIITPQVGKRPIQCIEGCEIASKENRLVEVEFD